MRILKRDGAKREFDKTKIVNAVLAAFKDVDGEVTEYAQAKAENIANYIEDAVKKADHEFDVEEIQDLVEHGLMSCKRKDVAKAYILYRNKRNNARGNIIDPVIKRIIAGTDEYWKSENSNKNAHTNTTQRDYMAGAISTDLTKREFLPADILEAHENGLIHFHDMDYFVQSMYNCCLINLEDMLQNGTVISGVKIEKPHRFSTACNIATQIIAQVASNQYGGQTITLSHLAPFVDVSRQRLRKLVREEFEHNDIPCPEEKINSIAEERLRYEIADGVQTIQYQVVTLMTTNGQAPFLTVYMYLDEVPEGRTRDDLAMIIEEMLWQRIQGVKNEQGVWVTPAFPKLIYTLDEDNIHEDSKYWYLTKLAAKCTAKRMVPDYISAKVMRELKGDVYPCMGCRSFLTPDRFTDAGVENPSNAGNWDGKHKYYGRFNQGVVTLNLVDIACSSGKDMDKFWKIFDERLDLCYRALMIRHKHLRGTTTSVAPVLWEHGALARLEKGSVIDPLLFNGYSTISLGFGGLAECVRYMLGVSHTSPEGEEFGLAVMQHMNDACAKWKAETNIDFSVYGTPMESVTYKFARCLQERFGIIEGVTDKDYITNSYHIHVTEPIDAFTKLTKEAKFQKLAPGGAISYVEVPNMQDNIPAVLAIMKHIYNNIMYAELNTKSDYCQVCGYDGEMQIKGDARHLYWECPNCGNHDEDKLNIARRTCGYIGTNFWNQGRTQEIKDRVLHLATESEVSL